jgi:hypothetical protein
MSDHDGITAVQVLIGSAALCTPCLADKSGLPVRDVELALRILVRTRDAALAEACDSCGTTMPAFRAKLQN